MNLGIKKMALGSVAALAIAGGALTINNTVQKYKPYENFIQSGHITHKDVDIYLEALANENKAHQARISLAKEKGIDTGALEVLHECNKLEKGLVSPCIYKVRQYEIPNELNPIIQELQKKLEQNNAQVETIKELVQKYKILKENGESSEAENIELELQKLLEK